MLRIDDPSAATSLPTPEAAGTGGYWTEGNPGSGVPATLVRASWLNAVQEELISVITAGGLTPSKTTYNQVLSAIQALIKSLRAGGTASAFTASIGSRSKGTIYTNSTGRPLVVAVTVQTGSTVGYGAVLKVGGLEVAQFYNQGGSVYYGYLFSIVPPGATYQVVDSVGTNTITLWQEL